KEVESPEQIEDFIALAKTNGSATTYWNYSDTWWPAWLSMEKQLGLPPLNDELIVPVFPNLANFEKGVELTVQARDKDACLKSLRKLAHCARWMPRFLGETTWHISMIAGLFPDQAKDLHLLAITMLKGFKADDIEVVKYCQTQLALHCINSAHNEEAVA